MKLFVEKFQSYNCIQIPVLNNIFKVCQNHFFPFRIVCVAGKEILSSNNMERNIPPLSLVGSNGQQPIDSLKNLVRDMTAVTSATHRLAEASLNSTQETQLPHAGAAGAFEDVLAENSIMTKSTLEALALVETGPEQLNQQVNSHLNSIRTLNSYTAHSSNK